MRIGGSNTLAARFLGCESQGEAAANVLVWKNTDMKGNRHFVNAYRSHAEAYLATGVAACAAVARDFITFGSAPRSGAVDKT